MWWLILNFVACRYVAPEYAGTGMLNETSDVYSFGILIMEIISGRVPVDYNRPPGEVSNGSTSLHSLNNEREKCIYELCGAIFSD